MVDQRHLAENAAFVQSIEQAVAEPDFDCSAFDDKEFLRRVALAENDIACFEVAYRAPALIKRSKSMFVSGIPRLNAARVILI